MRREAVGGDISAAGRLTASMTRSHPIRTRPTCLAMSFGADLR